MKNKEQLAPRKFGRPKTSLSEADKHLILEIMLISISKSFDAVEASSKSKILEQDTSKQQSSTNTAGIYPTMLSIRYQRDHSMSLVHLEGHTSKINRKEVWVVLDDSSRFILAGGEFAVATAEINIGLVRKVLKDYSKVRGIREVVTDHGTKFFANRLDKNGESASSFDVFLAKNGIAHILAGVRHPQTKWENREMISYLLEKQKII